jgi:hypothetical protein
VLILAFAWAEFIVVAPIAFALGMIGGLLASSRYSLIRRSEFTVVRRSEWEQMVGKDRELARLEDGDRTQRDHADEPPPKEEP